MIAALTARGFDAARLAFAARTSVAVCIAVLLAWMAGLEHPQWAGMAVWAASQPTRGALLEKSLFRLAGTVSGSIAGVALVVAGAAHPAATVFGLAAWVAACTWVGNIQRGFVAYGTVLAGYTAAMVSLLDTAHPDHVFLLGLDRFLTAATGVLVALAVGLIFAPAAPTRPLAARGRKALADLFAHVAADAPAPATSQRLAVEIAALDDLLDAHAAGSLARRRADRARRAALIAALGLLLRRRAPDGAPSPELRAALTRLSAAFSTAAAGDEAGAEAERRAVAAARALPATSGLAEALAPLLEALADLRAAPDATEPVPPVPVHRDWTGAAQSALRAFAALAFFGAIWLTTGWSAGAFLMLGLSIMISLFSTFENPAALMPYVALGQFLGAAAAFICRWLVWPAATSELELILMMVPFILIGPFLVGHRRTVAVSFDYNMVFLLLLQPRLPLSGTTAQSLTAAFAVTAAPLAALCAYRLIYPPTARRKVATLRATMLRGIARLAADPQAAAHRAVWEARLYHRALRLARLTAKSATGGAAALDAATAMATVGRAAMAAHALAAGEDAGRARAGRAALARLARIEVEPAAARRALAALGRRLGGACGAGGAGSTFAAAAAALAAALPTEGA